MNDKAESLPASGATEAPPTSIDVKPDSSSANGVKSLNSIGDALSKAMDGAKLVFADEKEESKETPPEEKAEVAEVVTEAEDHKDEPVEDEVKTEKTEDVHSNLHSKRPEWIEATKVLGEDGAKKVRPILRQMLDRENRLNAQIQPLAEVVNELKRHTGDEEGFKNARDLIRTYATDPATAVPMLENLLLDAKKRAGLEFSSDDLKQRLETLDKRLYDGEISEEIAAEVKADLLEVEKSRAKVRQTETKVSESQSEDQGRKAMEFRVARETALNNWESNIAGKDASYGSVTDLSDQRHGESVADQVFDAITGLISRKPNAGPDELVNEATRMYRIAKGRLATTGTREVKAVTGKGSSAQPAPKFKRGDIKAAMDAVPLVFAD